MKTPFKALAHSMAAIFCLILSHQECQAGPGDLGGGQAVVCRTSSGKIQSVELLDLWEARVRFGRKIKISKDPMRDQAVKAFDRLKAVMSHNSWNDGYWKDRKRLTGYGAFREEMIDSMDIILKYRSNRISGAALEKINDAYEEVVPNGKCKTEQLVRYNDNTFDPKNVLVNQDLVGKMDQTNQAALWVHEVFYHIMRKYGDSSSLRTRRVVGLLFTGYTFQSIESLLPEIYYVCTGKNDTFSNPKSRFYLFLSSTGATQEINVIPDLIEERHALDFRASDTASGIGVGSYGVSGGFSKTFGSSDVNYDHIVQYTFQGGTPESVNVYYSLWLRTTGQHEEIIPPIDLQKNMLTCKSMQK
jgi:hypothetical protein